MAATRSVSPSGTCPRSASASAILWARASSASGASSARLFWQPFLYPFLLAGLGAIQDDFDCDYTAANFTLGCKSGSDWSFMAEAGAGIGGRLARGLREDRQRDWQIQEFRARRRGASAASGSPRRSSKARRSVAPRRS